MNESVTLSLSEKNVRSQTSKNTESIQMNLRMIVDGLTSTSSIYRMQAYTKPTATTTDLNRLRKDVIKISGDFTKILECERDKQTNTKS